MQRLHGMLFFLMAALATNECSAQNRKNACLRVKFEHIAGGHSVIPRDSVYTTPLGEPFVLTKLKYYTSNFLLNGKAVVAGEDNYQLIDISRKTEYLIPVPEGSYNSFGFTIGVDSARNCSGAQSGALDPMNDMFWTWNSGYVMFKLEGTSPASTADRNRIEHHIGGYRSGQNVATPVNLIFEGPVNIIKGDTTTLTLQMNLDKYWQSENDVFISREPVCTLPGELAMKISANFSHLFTVVNERPK